MKVVHVPVKYKGEVRLPSGFVEKLPAKVVLAATIQFIDQIKGVARQIEESGRQVKLFKSLHGSVFGQVLGCDIRAPMMDCVYIGDGFFHASALLYSSKKVFAYNPLSKTDKEYTQEDIKKQLQMRKVKLTKFLRASRIGILVSTKKGQYNLELAREIKRKSEKVCYILVSDQIDIAGLDNFSFIDFFVNTACLRLCEDSNKIINYHEINF